MSRLQRASGAGYIPYTNANGKQTYQLLDTLVMGGDIGSGIDSMVAVWRNDTLTNGIIYDDSTHVGIGIASSLGARLHVRSEGSANGTMAIFERNNGTDLFTFLDNTSLLFGSTGSDAPRIYATNATANGSTPDPSRTSLSFKANGGTGTSKTSFTFLTESAITPASTGSGELVRHIYTFSPTAGTEDFSSLKIEPTINQTGTADGITRGVYVAPTLTSSSSWRSFETNVTSGYGFLSSGAALNVLAGNTKIGTSGDPVRDLEVDGELRVTADVDTAEQELIWAGNNEGDLNRLIVGEGLTVSGDSLIGEGVTYTAGTNILIAGDSISADIKWAHWDGGKVTSSTVTFSGLTTSLDTFDFPGDLHIGEGITYSSPLTAYGSSYAGFEFEQSGTYQMTWTAPYVTNAPLTNRIVEFDWHINGVPIDAFNVLHKRRWPAEVSTRLVGTSTIQFVAAAGQFLQLCMQSNNASLTELTTRGFHINIQKIRD